MRKDREERYERPVDLARDIENSLAGRPLVAAPESKAYRTRKFLRRNKTAVRAVALVAVALSVGLGYRPAADEYREWSETKRMNAFEVLAQHPDPAVVTDAAARERIKATGKPWKIKHTASGIVMLLCPPGEFLMGSTEKHRQSGEVQHRRVIRKAFYLSKNEVSKAEWRSIAGSNMGGFKGDDLPVESVSWNVIHEDFLAASRGFFRLPSEAEWECACGSGTTTAYSFGDTITKDQSCFQSGNPVACGSLSANPWGFREMHGNIWEWVADAWASYPAEGGIGAARANRRGRGPRLARRRLVRLCVQLPRRQPRQRRPRGHGRPPRVPCREGTPLISSTLFPLSFTLRFFHIEHAERAISSRAVVGAGDEALGRRARQRPGHCRP